MVRVDYHIAEPACHSFAVPPDGPLLRTVARCCKELGIATQPETAQVGLNLRTEHVFLADLKSTDSQTAVKTCLQLMKKHDVEDDSRAAETKAMDSSPSLRCQPQREDLSGMLVDWLERLDPELSSVDLEQQMDVVFGRTRHLPVSGSEDELKVGASGRIWQPYLLSSLTYCCSWKTFERCLSHLLSHGAVSRSVFCCTRHEQMEW